MVLYSYYYLINHSDTLTNVFIMALIAFGVIAVFFGLKYLKNRTNLRYRNILIATLAFSCLVICLQVNRFQTQKSNNNQVGQTVQIMKKISHKSHVPLKQMYCDSTNLTNGMLVKAYHHYYSIQTTSDSNAYQIHKAHPISSHVNYVTKHSWHFNWNFNDDPYWNIFLKLLLGYILFVIQINLMGKNNLAPSTATDQIENYVLGGIVGGVIYNTSITLLQFIIIILMWSTIIFCSRVLTDRSLIAKNIMQGSPQVVINNGHIDTDTVLKNGMSANDLIFKLRSAGVSDFQQVRRVILEQNGQLSVDNIHDKNASYPVILDGKFDINMLHHMHHSTQWIKKILKLKHHNVRDVFLGQITDGQLVLNLYPKTKTKLSRFMPHHKINLKDKFLQDMKKHHLKGLKK